MWCVYIINKNNRYYTGITTDLKNRMRQHGDPGLLYYKGFDDKYQAAKREKEIKGWTNTRNKSRAGPLGCSVSFIY